MKHLAQNQNVRIFFECHKIWNKKRDIGVKRRLQIFIRIMKSLCHQQMPASEIGQLEYLVKNQAIPAIRQLKEAFEHLLTQRKQSSFTKTVTRQIWPPSWPFRPSKVHLVHTTRPTAIYQSLYKRFHSGLTQRPPHRVTSCLQWVVIHHDKLVE